MPVSAKIVTAGPKAAKRWRCSTSATGSNCWTAAPSGSARLPTTCRGDAACNRTVTWVELRDKSSGKEFFYFNTHLDHQGKIAREEGVKLIVTKIRQIAGKKAAVILGGDLNTSIDNPHLKPLTRLMASARDTAAETDQKGTFNGFGSAPDTIILDHLFYRGRMKCRKFVTLDGDYGAPYISDHYPIAMVFTL